MNLFPCLQALHCLWRLFSLTEEMIPSYQHPTMISARTFYFAKRNIAMKTLLHRHVFNDNSRGMLHVFVNILIKTPGTPCGDNYYLTSRQSDNPVISNETG